MTKLDYCVLMMMFSVTNVNITGSAFWGISTLVWGGIALWGFLQPKKKVNE